MTARTWSHNVLVAAITTKAELSVATDRNVGAKPRTRVHGHPIRLACVP